METETRFILTEDHRQLLMVGINAASQAAKEWKQHGELSCAKYWKNDDGFG